MCATHRLQLNGGVRSFFLQPFPKDPLFPTGYLQLHPHDFFMWPSCRISLDLCYMPQNTRAEGAAGVPRHATFQDGRCTAPLVTWEDLRWSWAMDPEDFFTGAPCPHIALSKPLKKPPTTGCWWAPIHCFSSQILQSAFGLIWNICYTCLLHFFWFCISAIAYESHAKSILNSTIFFW